MQIPQKISPLIVFGSLVIITGLAILVVISPLHPAANDILHPQDPRAICLKPSLEENTLSTLWDTIVNRTGIDPRSAEFEQIGVNTDPDGAIDELSLSFFATAKGEEQRYQIDLRYDPALCGMLYISSVPSSAMTSSSQRSPRNPGEVMAELVKVRPSVFGVLDQEAEISTQVTREENGTYSPLSCWEDLYTLRNGTIAHEDQVIVHSTRAGATHWRIESRRCIDLPGYDPACYPENAFHVISDQPVRDVDLITTGTGNNRTAAIQDCPGRTVEGQSCKTSFGSETCINWTATIPARYTGNLIKGK